MDALATLNALRREAAQFRGKREKERIGPIAPIGAVCEEGEDTVLSACREAFLDANAERWHGRSPEKPKTYRAWPVSAPIEVVSQATCGREARAHRKQFPIQASLPTSTEFAAVYRAVLTVARAQEREKPSAPVENDGYFRRLKRKQTRAKAQFPPAEVTEQQERLWAERQAHLDATGKNIFGQSPQSREK